MSDFGMIDMVSNQSPLFPWTKFHKLWCLPEIYNAQAEDGFPAPEKIAFLDAVGEHERVWLVMQGSKALGFTVLELRGKVWCFLHASFRKEVPGTVKKCSVIWTLHQALCVMDMMKVTGFIAAYNRPARFLAREVGMTPEGRIAKSFLRNGRYHDNIAYGVTRDEFLIRFCPKCPERPGNAPE